MTLKQSDAIQQRERDASDDGGQVLVLQWVDDHAQSGTTL